MSQEPEDPRALPSGLPWDGPGMPAEARRIGLDRNTVEGAWLELASNLDRRKKSHLVIAVVLLAVFVLPLLSQVGYILRAL